MSDIPRYPRFPRVNKKPDTQVFWFDWLLYNPTLRRVIWFLVTVTIFLLALQLSRAEGPLWILLYLVVALMVVGETLITRNMLIRNRHHRGLFTSWVENLENAPPPVRTYWLNLFAAVEQIMTVFYPSLWHRMNEMQRWIVVDVVELGMHKRVAGIIEAYQEYLEQHREPALEQPNETASYQQGQLRDNRPMNAHIRAFLDKNAHE